MLNNTITTSDWNVIKQYFPIHVSMSLIKDMEGIMKPTQSILMDASDGLAKHEV